MNHTYDFSVAPPDYFKQLAARAVLFPQHEYTRLLPDTCRKIANDVAYEGGFESVIHLSGSLRKKQDGHLFINIIDWRYYPRRTVTPSLSCNPENTTVKENPSALYFTTRHCN